MKRQVRILNDAKQDFLDIRAYVKSKFGLNVWAEVNLEFIKILRQLGTDPELGSPIEEIQILGMDDFRQRLVR